MDFMCEQVVRCNLGTKKFLYKLLIFNWSCELTILFLHLLLQYLEHVHP